MSSWRFGDRAPTYLETPLWLPRIVMALGMAALCLSVLPHFDRKRKTVRHISLVHGGAQMSPELQIVVTFACSSSC